MPIVIVHTAIGLKELKPCPLVVGGFSVQRAQLDNYKRTGQQDIDCTTLQTCYAPTETLWSNICFPELGLTELASSWLTSFIKIKDNHPSFLAEQALKNNSVDPGGTQLFVLFTLKHGPPFTPTDSKQFGLHCHCNRVSRCSQHGGLSGL